jgi:hypothetical protein
MLAEINCRIIKRFGNADLKDAKALLDDRAMMPSVAWAVGVRGHFPGEEAATKLIWLVQGGAINAPSSAFCEDRAGAPAGYAVSASI